MALKALAILQAKIRPKALLGALFLLSVTTLPVHAGNFNIGVSVDLGHIFSLFHYRHDHYRHHKSGHHRNYNGNRRYGNHNHGYSSRGYRHYGHHRPYRYRSQYNSGHRYYRPKYRHHGGHHSRNHHGHGNVTLNWRF